MPIRMEERFVVRAPAAAVWSFLVDPRRVVECVPGGELLEVADERNFRGRVRVTIGPLTLPYAGRIRLAEMDAEALRVRIIGFARHDEREDRARLTLDSWLDARGASETEVLARARIDVGGAIVELGAPFLHRLAHVVFQDFAACVAARLEAEAAGGRAPGAGTPPPRREPLRALPLVWRALRAWAASAFTRRRV